MMKKFFLPILTACAALMLAACQGDAPENRVRIVAHASIMQPSSGNGSLHAPATHLDGNDANGYKVVWSEGDMFALHTEQGIIYLYLQNGDGEQDGTFEADATTNLSSESGYAAYYPARFSPGPDYSNWLTEQFYSPGGCTSAPMAADVESCSVSDGVVDISLQFRNLGGLLRISTSQKEEDRNKCFTAKEIVFRSKNEQGSDVNVALRVKGVLASDAVSIPLEGSYTESSFTISPTDYAYIALPEGNYTNVSLQFTRPDGRSVTKNLNANKVLVIKTDEITPIAVPVGEEPANEPQAGE